MRMSPNFVLADFNPTQLAAPMAQRFALEVSKYGFFRAYCIQNGIVDGAEVSKARDHVTDLFDKYAVSSDYIKRRQLVFFPRRDEIKFAGSQIEVADPAEPHLKMWDTEVDPDGPDLGARLNSYGLVARRAVDEMYRDAPSEPDDIVHVSCSGYLSPSPVERFASDVGWTKATITHSYHMGCYGAFPGIRMAHGFLASAYTGMTPPKKRVDIIHTELFSAHNNIADLTPVNIITMTLFGDGLTKYSLYTEQALREAGLRGFKIVSMLEQILPKSLDDMTYMPGPHQFTMTLSPMVPLIIRDNIRSFVTTLCGQAGLDYEAVKSDLLFAIHPGGPKIVDHIQDALGLTNQQAALSTKVLSENGNMSSATVPCILSQMIDEAPLGARVVAQGVGPGLTAAGMLLEKV